MYEVHGVFPKLNYQRCVFRPFNFCSTTKTMILQLKEKKKRKKKSNTCITGRVYAQRNLIVRGGEA